MLVSGHEFVASNVTITPDGEKRVMRFTGTCTDNPVNDSIRRTGYNGGRYGWFVNA